MTEFPTGVWCVIDDVHLVPPLVNLMMPEIKVTMDLIAADFMHYFVIFRTSLCSHSTDNDERIITC